MINLEGNYLVKEDGRIYSFKGEGRHLKPSINVGGYHVVSIYVDGKKRQYKVHDLVAEKYIPNPEGKKYIHHIDGNKLNNSVGNLLWVTREEHAAIHCDKKSRTYIFTDEMRKKISEAHKGKIISDETRKRISEAKIGKKHSEEHVRKVAEAKKRPVVQYDKENNFINKWKSALDAELGCGVSRCHIASVCKGKRRSAGGYIWRYGQEG